MQIKPDSALGRALSNAPRTPIECKREQIERMQTAISESITEKRRECATLSGAEATALRVNIANLERMLDGAFEMGAALDATDEQRIAEQSSDEQRETDERGAFNVNAVAAQHRADRYGHAAK